MCEDCVYHPLNSYTEFDGTIWYYRCRDFKFIERSLNGETWKEVTDEDLAEMSENHMQYVESMIIPF